MGAQLLPRLAAKALPRSSFNLWVGVLEAICDAISCLFIFSLAGLRCGRISKSSGRHSVSNAISGLYDLFLEAPRKFLKPISFFRVVLAIMIPQCFGVVS